MTTALARKIESIRNGAAVSNRVIAELLDTTPETVSRWVNGKVDPKRESLQRLLELEFFISELSEFYAPDEAHLWLLSPHKLLDGASPADRIKEGRTDEVFALLDQLRSGAYV
jgi:transcriptional regulator with XRE-family HTH domain